MKKTKFRKINNYRKRTYFLLGLIITAVFFLGIGYSQISDINLILSGTATTTPANDVLITNIDYLSGTDVNPNNQVIGDSYLTLMTSQIVLGNSLSSSITYKVKVKNNGSTTATYNMPIYSTDLGYDNQDIEFIVSGINRGDTLQPNEEKEFTVTFKYVDSLSTITNQTLNSIINFQFQDGTIEEFAPTGVCEFHGKGNDIVGDCANNQQIDFIDTGIALFDAEHHDKDFEIGFTIDSIDSSRFRSGKVDTIFDCLNDNSPYPGITFRIENSKWLLQVGTGSNNKKIYFDKNAIQSFVLRKVNNKVYYAINGGSFVYVDDLTSIPTFNNTVTLGSSYDGNGVIRSERFLIANLSGLYVKVAEQGTLEEPLTRTYAIVDQEILDFLGENMTTAYSLTTQHEFDGTTANIINTGVELLNYTNYQNSFVVSLTIDEFASSGQVNQATLFNIKDESNSPSYPGLVFRVNGNQFELAMKDGTGTTASVTIPFTANRVNIIKKGMKMYYQVDLGVINPLSSTNDFSSYPVANTFSIPATFGCIIDSSGNYNRMLKGKLSDLKILVPA